MERSSFKRNEIAIDINDNKSEIHQNDERIEYNFSRKKGKSCSEESNNLKERADAKGKAHEMDDVGDIKELDPHARKMNVSVMNRENLLIELNTQSERVTNAENQQRKKRVVI